MLTAEQKLKQLLVYRILDERLEDPEEVDDRYDEIWTGELRDEDDRNYEDALQDAKSELRHSGEETNIGARYCSRHYDCHEVAAEMLDGSYVGWTYWYGGGKHGDPDSIDWMDDAYDVEFTEETRVVKVFRRK